MNQAKILIIDDEASVRDVLSLNLRSQNYILAEAGNASDGLRKVREFHPNLIVLDLGLPDKNGYEVLKELRSWTEIPVIVLTVNDDENSKVQMLDAGADDYLTKPFGASEFLARIRLALRHRSQLEATPVFVSDDLRIDLNSHQVRVGERIIKLTNTEYEILQRLVREAGKVVPQAKLLREVWGASAEGENHYLRIYIKQLRKKIEKDPASPHHILTEVGVGYRLI